MKLCALLLVLAVPAWAQDALQARSLAAGCAQCHGTDGHAVAGSAIPALAGLPAAVLVERMRAYRSGSLPGTVMPQIAKGYDDAQVARLAAYFAQVK